MSEGRPNVSNMNLRDFLYLDRPLVRDFLAQIEGGTVDELTERETKGGSGSLGGQIGPKSLRVEGEKSKEHSLQTEAVVKQVGTSEFDRLVSYLEEDGLLVIEEIDDLETVAGIRRKQFIEVDARIRLSGMQQVVDLIGTFTTALPMMKQFGSGIDINDGTAGGLSAIAALGALESGTALIATVPGDVNFRAVIELNPKFATVTKWDVDASVLMKVQRVLKPGERQLVGDPMGGLLQLMPEADRGKFLETFSTPELQKLGVVGDAEVAYPAVVATPIAIYR